MKRIGLGHKSATWRVAVKRLAIKDAKHNRLLPRCMDDCWRDEVRTGVSRLRSYLCQLVPRTELRVIPCMRRSRYERSQKTLTSKGNLEGSFGNCKRSLLRPAGLQHLASRCPGYIGGGPRPGGQAAGGSSQAGEPTGYLKPAHTASAQLSAELKQKTEE